MPVEQTCPHLVGCSLFPKGEEPGRLRVFQVLYCEGSYHSCARMDVMCRGKTPPVTLLPDGQTLAG